MDVSKYTADLDDQRSREVKYPPQTPKRVAHIDADFMAYQVSAESKDELQGLKPRRTVDQMEMNACNGLHHLMRTVGAVKYIAHITPPGSDKGGRYDQAVTKEYQGNRKGKEKPEFLDHIRGYIGEHLSSEVHMNQEADDGMAQKNYADPVNSVIVSKDKDLRMVPGLHWDFKEEHVADVEGFGNIWIDQSTKTKKLLGWGPAFFWAQLLMGDTADNIAGLPSAEIDGKTKRVGPMLAHDLLEGINNNKDAFARVKELWSGSKHEWTYWKDGTATTWGKAMTGDMKLLWMRRKPDENDVLDWLRENAI